jgi:hypothetical protein
MSLLYAFNLSEVQEAPVVLDDGPLLEGYDPQEQRLVWHGEQDAVLGAAVCTAVCCGGYNNCSSHGTYCSYGGSTTCGCIPSYDGYKCDYG